MSNSNVRATAWTAVCDYSVTSFCQSNRPMERFWSFNTNASVWMSVHLRGLCAHMEFFWNRKLNLHSYVFCSNIHPPIRAWFSCISMNIARGWTLLWCPWWRFHDRLDSFTLFLEFRNLSFTESSVHFTRYRRGLLAVGKLSHISGHRTSVQQRTFSWDMVKILKSQNVRGV